MNRPDKILAGATGKPPGNAPAGRAIQSADRGEFPPKTGPSRSGEAPMPLAGMTAMRHLQAIIAVTALAMGWAFGGQPSLQPLHIGRCATLDRAFDVAVLGRYAYVADGEAGLQVYDVSDPDAPIRVGGYSPELWAVGVAVSGNYVYLACESYLDEQLVVIDVSNPTNCTQVGGVTTAGEASAVVVVGHYAYLADNENLAVIDVSNPASSVQVGSYGGSYIDVAVSGKFAYLVPFENGWSGLKVVDVGSATNCVLAGQFPTSERVWGVAVAGRFAYLANGNAGLQVIDVSDPARCVRVGGYQTPGFAQSVAVSRNFAYVTDDTAGLVVIDVSNPANCIRVGGYDTGGSAYKVAVVDDRIYVADGQAGLLVLSTLPNVQSTVRVYSTPSIPFTLEVATNLTGSNSWTPLITTNVSSVPFDYVDFDVRLSEKPQRFYRARQP